MARRTFGIHFISLKLLRLIASLIPINEILIDEDDLYAPVGAGPDCCVQSSAFVGALSCVSLPEIRCASGSLEPTWSLVLATSLANPIILPSLLRFYEYARF